MRRSLIDSRVLLTGASSGIGRALALALARRGARLLLAARREDLLRSLVDECAALGGGADFAAGDLTDAAYRSRLVARTAELWGGLDVLVNNAGVSAHGLFAESDETTLRRVMELNFFAVAELTRAALPLLAAHTLRTEAAAHKSRPAIVNIGSIIGHRGLPFNSEYSASKFALRGWTEALRAELAAVGIDVLLMSPGTTNTEFVEHLVARRAALPWGSAVGISAAVVADQTVRALERNRREVFPNWRGRALVLANRAIPGIVDRVVKRMARKAKPLVDTSAP
jgi:short-subunit dehydrogenase